MLRDELLSLVLMSLSLSSGKRGGFDVFMFCKVLIPRGESCKNGSKSEKVQMLDIISTDVAKK